MGTHTGTIHEATHVLLKFLEEKVELRLLPTLKIGTQRLISLQATPCCRSILLHQFFQERRDFRTLLVVIGCLAQVFQHFLTRFTAITGRLTKILHLLHHEHRLLIIQFQLTRQTGQHYLFHKLLHLRLILTTEATRTAGSMGTTTGTTTKLRWTTTFGAAPLRTTGWTPTEVASATDFRSTTTTGWRAIASRGLCKYTARHDQREYRRAYVVSDFHNHFL